MRGRTKGSHRFGFENKSKPIDVCVRACVGGGLLREREREYVCMCARETEKDSGRRLMSEWMCLRERERERGRMILRALYDSLMMEDLLRKFHRFSRRRERQ